MIRLTAICKAENLQEFDEGPFVIPRSRALSCTSVFKAEGSVLCLAQANGLELGKTQIF